ncbi:hypothetical protein T8T21_05715 [Limimaricola variabilis]|uniref:hypothetical protein n=1 Tax=Limimaricola variabilis TaxID=1492771 RepID=UPI002AC91EB1|nr:hypothetical protein [Limimaricola variabilis]WPY95620.1 hypothetical protein T8T21_05715 [Limimaricola variabilis]
MSNKVSALAYSRVAGSPSRKAVLVYIADKASDDGSGIWASKGTIAAETELSLSSVKRIMRDFEAERLIGRRGRRACENGATIEYAINLDVLSDLPKVEVPSTKFRKPEEAGSEQPRGAKSHRSEPVSDVNRYQGEPGSQCDRYQGDPEPGSQGTPYPGHGEPQTTLEPSLNHGGGGQAREQDRDPPLIAAPREQFLEAMGVDPVSGIIGPNARQIGTEIDMAIARRWAVDLGLTLDQQLTVIGEVMARKPDGPPNSFKFFDKPMARHAAELKRLASDPLSPANPSTRKGARHDRNGTFDQRHDELLRRIAAGEIDRGPDPSDPWAN